MRKRKGLGFWGLGAILLAGLLINLVLFVGAESRYQTAKAEYDTMRRQLYEFGMGQREDFDRERFEQVKAEYNAAYRVRHGYHGRYSVEGELLFFGLVFLMWLLAALGRGVLRAAKWSVERDERRALDREQKREPWE